VKTLLKVLGALVALVLLAVLVGALLPREHSASRSIVLHAPAAEVWAVMTDFAGAATWREGLESVELLPPQDGRTVFRETSGFGPLTIIVDESTPPRRLVTRILDTDQGFGGTWTYVLAEEGPGTRVTITEDGVIDNPLFRFLARFAFGYEKTLDSYLRALARHFGESGEPGPAAP